jgi:AcrR family transcriptional regulator
MKKKRHLKPRRDPLSRERVVETAIALADDHGVDALTMRRLGSALGVEAMSLYHHVSNKDDVLDGMVDAIMEEIGLPEGPDFRHAAYGKLNVRHRTEAVARASALDLL